MKTQRNTVLRIFFIIIYVVLGWTIVLPLIATHFIMKTSFGTRVTKNEKSIDESYYKGLIKKPISFNSSGHKMSGGFFYYEDKKPFKGLVIVSHGIGTMMYNYLNRMEYFARKGYLTMGFDMTGCNESGGKGMGGLQQGPIDVKNSVKFAASSEEAKGLKIYLYGHSWSGYSTAAALNYPETRIVDKVITCSGFNNFWDTTFDQGQRRVGKIFIIAKPFMYLYSFIKFGRAYNYEGMKGINKYNKPVLIAHSKDDPTVPYEVGIITHKSECTNPYVEYLDYEDRGHTLSRPIETEKSILKSLEGKPIVKQGKTNVFQYNVDNKYRYCTLDEMFEIDESYMDTILAFIEK